MNMEPENTALEKENSFPSFSNSPFSGSMLIFRGVDEITGFGLGALFFFKPPAPSAAGDARAR